MHPPIGSSATEQPPRPIADGFDHRLPAGAFAPAVRRAKLSGGQ